MMRCISLFLISLLLSSCSENAPAIRTASDGNAKYMIVLVADEGDSIVAVEGKMNLERFEEMFIEGYTLFGLRKTFSEEEIVGFLIAFDDTRCEHVPIRRVVRQGEVDTYVCVGTGQGEPPAFQAYSVSIAGIKEVICDYLENGYPKSPPR